MAPLTSPMTSPLTSPDLTSYVQFGAREHLTPSPPLYSGGEVEVRSAVHPAPHLKVRS